MRSVHEDPVRGAPPLKCQPRVLSTGQLRYCTRLYIRYGCVHVCMYLVTSRLRESRAMDKVSVPFHPLSQRQLCSIRTTRFNVPTLGIQ